MPAYRDRPPACLTAYFAKESIPVWGVYVWYGRACRDSIVCITYLAKEVTSAWVTHTDSAKAFYFCLGLRHAATVQPQCLISNRY